MVTENNFWEDTKRKDYITKLIKNSEAARSFLDGDGHSIYKGDYLIEIGFPEDLVKKYETTLKSDYSSGKSTIFDKDGNMVDEMVGIPALTFHYAIAEVLLLEGGVDYNDTIMGRGTQARELSRAIMKAVGVTNG
jgi:hypothetical protein